MCRNIHHIDESEYIAYGLDRVLGYFADVFVKGIDEEGKEIFHCTKEIYGKSQVLQLFSDLGVEKDMNQLHLKSIAMDLPLANSEEEYQENIDNVFR